MGAYKIVNSALKAFGKYGSKFIINSTGIGLIFQIQNGNYLFGGRSLCILQEHELAGKRIFSKRSEAGCNFESFCVLNAMCASGGKGSVEHSGKKNKCVCISTGIELASHSLGRAKF